VIAGQTLYTQVDNTGTGNQSSSHTITFYNILEAGEVFLSTKNYEIDNETSSAHTVLANTILPVDTSSGSVIITPPTSPNIGDWFMVVDSKSNATLNNITIDFVNSSQNLHSLLENYIINVDKGGVKFIYTNISIGWIII